MHTHGYAGPKYCTCCHAVFRLHVIKQVVKGCTRQQPCDFCSNVLAYFDCPINLLSMGFGFSEQHIVGVPDSVPTVGKAAPTSRRAFSLAGSECECERRTGASRAGAGRHHYGDGAGRDQEEKEDQQQVKHEKEEEDDDDDDDDDDDWL